MIACPECGKNPNDKPEGQPHLIIRTGWLFLRSTMRRERAGSGRYYVTADFRKGSVDRSVSFWLREDSQDRSNLYGNEDFFDAVCEINHSDSETLSEFYDAVLPTKLRGELANEPEANNAERILESATH